MFVSFYADMEEILAGHNSVAVQRWVDSQPESEAAVLEQFRTEGSQLPPGINSPGERYAAHSHTYHKVIYVVRGSIRFGLPSEGKTITLNE